MLQLPYRYKINTSSFRHYWTKGIGVELLHKLDIVPRIEDAEQFIPLLYQYDKAGDKVAVELYLKQGFKAANAYLLQYLDGIPIPSELKEVLDAFFGCFNIEPDWLDWDLLEVGQRFCQRPGLSSLIVLRDYCLMGGYESAAINKPLVYTGALKKGAVKRLTDTVEFWVQITKPGNLRPTSMGFKQVMLTRMIHSFSRVQILEKTDWEIEKWGIPINTWDMLATHLGFSEVFLVGLRRMGIKPGEEEIKGLFHFWKYISYLLGIPVELLPDHEPEAIKALYYWTMTQREGDVDTLQLARALQEEPVQAFYPKSLLMRKMMREVHLFYNHYLLGDYSCQLLGLPKTRIGRLALAKVWRNKQLERNIEDDAFREKCIRNGAEEQENVRQIYETYNKG